MNLYGASGHAKVIIDILKVSEIKVNKIFDDNKEVSRLLDHEVFHEYDINCKEDTIISIGDNITRKEIVEDLDAKYGKATHPKATIDETVQIEDGTVIMAGVVINSSTRIGRHCIINTAANVDHDCVLDDYVHISPSASLCGGIQVGEGTHIGAGAVIIPNIKIGKWCTIGAGTVIIRDVPDGATVVGNPGRILEKEANIVPGIKITNKIDLDINSDERNKEELLGESLGVIKL